MKKKKNTTHISIRRGHIAVHIACEVVGGAAPLRGGVPRGGGGRHGGGLPLADVHRPRPAPHVKQRLVHGERGEVWGQPVPAHLKRNIIVEIQRGSKQIGILSKFSMNIFFVFLKIPEYNTSGIFFLKILEVFSNIFPNYNLFKELSRNNTRAVIMIAKTSGKDILD